MSTPLPLDSLEIRRFRVFEHLRIERLGRVNLIVGKNNVGKSSLLEALWLYANHGSPDVIWKILESRDEGRRPRRSISERVKTELEILSIFKHLFNGRRDLDQEIDPIQIGPIDNSDKVLSLSLDWVVYRTDEDGTRKRRRIPFDDYQSFDDPVLGLSVRYEKQKPFYRLGQDRLSVQGSDQESCVFISANGLPQSQIGLLWDSVSLTDLEDDVLESLRIIAPEVERVSLIDGGQDVPGRQDRVPIVKTIGFKEPIPLRSLGEGMNRLFGLALALVNAKDGILLVDEIESGLHYSVQPNVWRLVFEVARRLDVQVFATTHSWDCITAFQQAAQEAEQDEGVLIRLMEKKGGIVADLFGEEELGIATREEVEVR